MNKTFLDMYNDYRNNFLTVERFAEHYGISEELAKEIIKECSDYLSPNQQIDYLFKGYKNDVIPFKNKMQLEKGFKVSSEYCFSELAKIVDIEVKEITVSCDYLNLAKNVRKGYFITYKKQTVFADAVNQCFVNTNFINFNLLK